MIKYYGKNRHRQALWLCKCSCNGDNSETVVIGSDLRSGKTKSCGCLRKETSSKFTTERNKRYNTYDLTGEYGIGYTNTNGDKYYFDLEDYDLIKNYCWYKNAHGYIESEDIRENKIKMHRLLMNCPDNMEIDHIFHDKWDNRKKYLRIVTRSQNQMNLTLKSNNTSGVTGISWDKKSDKWRSYITINQKRIELGCYNDFDKAVKLRKEAEKKYFGEYRYKNKIKGEIV